MNPSFIPSELEFKEYSQDELIRTRKIFEALRNKARENIELTEHEKDFFCHGLQLSVHNDGDIEDFKCCDNFKFKFLYLTYSHDLSGASTAYKPNKLLLTEAIVENEEKLRDIKYLNEKSKEWKTIVNKLNHKEVLLQEASKEARYELKNNTDSLNGKNSSFESNLNFSIEELEREILLKSKYIYCISSKYFEALNREDLLLEINDQVIEINEYSIIHIVNRHFAARTIYYDTKKSFHSEEFEPTLLNKKLGEILRQIDASNIYKGLSINSIAFQFKGTDYQIWTSLKKKHIGNQIIEFRRLNTFYPITENDEINKLLENHKIIIINENIKLYLPGKDL